MDNFKLNFLSRGQLGSLRIDNFFFFKFKTVPCYEYFLVTLFLHLLLERSAEIVLNVFVLFDQRFKIAENKPGRQTLETTSKKAHSGHLRHGWGLICIKSTQMS